MRKYKLRCDSTFGQLPAEQRERLDEWLFEEKVNRPEALERARKEFGITASLTGLSRYYLWRREERTVEDLAGVRRTVRAVNGTAVNVVSMRESSFRLIGRQLLECAMEGAKVSELAALAHIILEGERRQIQRERLELAREKFHFNAAEAALAELPHVGQMTAEELKREKERVDGIIARLFGKVPNQSHV